jgi:hypothetical protein
MITSKQIQKLLEDYEKTVKVLGGSCNIYKNPGSSDYTKLFKESKYKLLKFIADNSNHTVYVWSADRGIHDEITKSLNLFSRLMVWDPNLICGDAQLENGKSKMINSASLNGVVEFIKSIDSNGNPKVNKYLDTFNINWSWLDRYIANSSNSIVRFKNKIVAINPDLFNKA